MCLMLPIRADDDVVSKATGPDELFQAIQSVLQTNVQSNYSDCSAR